MDAQHRSPSSPDTTDPILVGVRIACRTLNISPRTLWALTSADVIPVRRIGRAVRYSPAELAAWVACGCPTEPGSAERVRRAVRMSVDGGNS
jgi:hypothetical protein